MFQSRDADEIVTINRSLRDFMISRGRLLHNMVNIVPFAGLSGPSTLIRLENAFVEISQGHASVASLRKPV